MKITRRTVLSYGFAAAAFALSWYYPKEIFFILVWDDDTTSFYAILSALMVLFALLAMGFNVARVIVHIGIVGPLAFAMVKILMQVNFATFNMELILCAIFSALLWLHVLLAPDVGIPSKRLGSVAYILYFVIFLYPLCHTYTTPW